MKYIIKTRISLDELHKKTLLVMRNLVKDLLKIEEIDNLNIDNLIKKKCGQDCLPEIYKKSRSYVRQRIIDESYKNSIDSKSYMILKEEVGKLLLINQEKE